MSTAPRSSAVLTLTEAVSAAPVLAQLRERMAQSEQCLSQILPLIPAPMRSHVKAGPIEGSEWCLLVGNVAASTKLRQLLPSFLGALSRRGSGVTSIRLKVQTSHR